MKKLLILTLVLAMLAVAFVGCDAKAQHFTGEWKFSKISKVEIASDVSAERIEELKAEYGAADEAGVAAAVLADFNADGTFTPCYVKFEKKSCYTYDPLMEREATWVLYQTGENEGFISFYSELDAADGNPDPANNPAVVYDPATDTLSLTLRYVAYTVTIELVR